MNRRSFSVACFVAAALVAIGIASQAWAGFTGPTKHSSEFTYRYEMDVAPWGQDLDSNGVMDFDASPDATRMTLSGGILTIDSTDQSSNPCIVAYSPTPPGGPIWPAQFTGDYTTEFRVRVISENEDAPGGAIRIFHALPSGLDGGMLNVGASFTDWGQDGVRYSTADNTDGFHTFRVARDTTTHRSYVWRDDVLIGDGLGSNYGGAISDLFLGSNTTGVSGVADVDYLRIMPGAFGPAPMPAPSTPALLVAGLLCYARRRRR